MAGEKSRIQIWYDLAKANDQANKLDEAAKAIKNESERFEGCRSEVTRAWEGDNAARFAGKMDVVTSDLRTLAKQLEATADVIRKNARNIYDAEMEAKRLADIRNHS